MATFTIPAREQVSPTNQQIFDNLTKMAGHVPNVLAILAYSENALGNYLTFSNGKSSLKAREREVVNLVVSQINECQYCLSAHTGLARRLGFTDDQILEIRRVSITFDSKLDALARLTKGIVEKKGHAGGLLIDEFFAAGYDKGNLMDLVLVIGDKTITNYLYALTKIPIDYPVVSTVLSGVLR
jgi:AhpD family alkylhydroperoxidase